MRKIFVIAGHTNVAGLDRGASGNGYIEGELTVEFRDLVIAELNKIGVQAITDDNRNALSQTLSWLRGKFTAKDILFDIHYNAGTPQANGTEAIVPNNATPFEASIAFKICKAFERCGFRNRGVKPESSTARKRLGWMRPNAENILLEVCFISNQSDMQIYQLNKHILAKDVAAVLSGA